MSKRVSVFLKEPGIIQHLPTDAWILDKHKTALIGVWGVDLKWDVFAYCVTLRNGLDVLIPKANVILIVLDGVTGE